MWMRFRWPWRLEPLCCSCLRRSTPRTNRRAEEAFPRHYSHAFFSALTPGSHILKHTGPSNRMLRVWLPLCGMDGFRLRVGKTILRPEALRMS